MESLPERTQESRKSGTDNMVSLFWEGEQRNESVGREERHGDEKE